MVHSFICKVAVASVSHITIITVHDLSWIISRACSFIRKMAVASLCHSHLSRLMFFWCYLLKVVLYLGLKCPIALIVCKVSRSRNIGHKVIFCKCIYSESVDHFLNKVSSAVQGLKLNFHIYMVL